LNMVRMMRFPPNPGRVLFDRQLETFSYIFMCTLAMPNSSDIFMNNVYIDFYMFLTWPNNDPTNSKVIVSWTASAVHISPRWINSGDQLVSSGFLYKGHGWKSYFCWSNILSIEDVFGELPGSHFGFALGLVTFGCLIRWVSWILLDLLGNAGD
jgi:hypothetical protein